MYSTTKCDGMCDFLVTAPQHQIEVPGPPFGSYSWQHKMKHGYDLQAFVLDWDVQQAHCPQGHTSFQWTPGHDASGDPVFRIRFDHATCRACPTRQVYTAATDAPRQLTVRPHAHHEAMQATRQHQEAPEFKEKYALRSGVESSLSQGIRRFALRQSRYRGLAGMHLQQLLTCRGLAWRSRFWHAICSGHGQACCQRPTGRWLWHASNHNPH
jgi:transposase